MAAGESPAAPASHPPHQLLSFASDWLQCHVEHQEGGILDRAHLHQLYSAAMVAEGITPVNNETLGKLVKAWVETDDFTLTSKRKGVRGDSKWKYMGIGLRAQPLASRRRRAAPPPLQLHAAAPAPSTSSAPPVTAAVALVQSPRSDPDSVSPIPLQPPTSSERSNDIALYVSQS